MGPKSNDLCPFKNEVLESLQSPSSSLEASSNDTGLLCVIREVGTGDREVPAPSLVGHLGPSFPCGSAVKASAWNEGDAGLIRGLERSPGEEKGYPLQYSGLENSMDCIVHGDMTYLFP